MVHESFQLFIFMFISKMKILFPQVVFTDVNPDLTVMYNTQVNLLYLVSSRS